MEKAFRCHLNPAAQALWQAQFNQQRTYHTMIRVPIAQHAMLVCYDKELIDGFEHIAYAYAW